MQVLLINKNPIVSELFILSTKDINNVEIDEIGDIGEVSQKEYDILFIDDGNFTEDKLREIIYLINAKLKVLLFSKDKKAIDGIDKMLKKPFLPSTIISMFNSSDFPKRVTVEKDIEKLLVKNNSLEDKIKSLVLDKNEIDTIKRLLLDSEDSTQTSNNIKVNDIKMENRLISLLMDMKPKMIKKILKGAEINITIKFPKEDR